MKDEIPEPYVLESMEDVDVVALPAHAATLRQAVRGTGTLFEWAAGRDGAHALAGRGVTWRIPAPSRDGAAAAGAGAGAADEPERWVVRHYRRGGFVARLVEDRYLDIGRRRPVRELRASAGAREHGIDTPEVIGFALYPAGVWYRADIITRYVPGSRDLADVLFGEERAEAALRRRAMGVAGTALAHAHRQGLVHNDLNAKNLLLMDLNGERPRAWILDLDRATIARDGVARFERNAMLRRFARSLRKWEKSRRLPLDAGEREAFAEAYARGGVE